MNYGLDKMLAKRRLFLLVFVAAVVTCTDPDAPESTRDGPVMYRTPTGLEVATPPELAVTAGDISSCSNTGDSQTAALLDTMPGTILALGDQVYENGTTSEFANCYGPTWGRHKDRTRPAAGNHEYNTTGATPYFNYFGAAAGAPGQGYYSFELGAWHVIVLNSNIAMKVGSPQMSWLVADLASHPNLCTVAYFHHPLYSSYGGSGSGGITYNSVRPLYEALYNAGVDLVLSGHRHFYERIAPIKPDGTQDDEFGFRQLIVGSGGIGGGSQTNVFPASQVREGHTRGVVRLLLYEDSYTWRFVPVAGETFSDAGSTACHGAPVSASQSGVTASPPTITTGGEASVSTITVTVKNANGSPVPGATVVLSATGSGNTITQPSGPSDASGVATGSFSSTVAGNKTITATANGLSITQGATVAVVPEPPPPQPGDIAPTLLTAGNNTVNQKVYTTEPISPAPYSLVTVAVLSHRTPAAAASPTLSGGGMANWSEVATVTFDTIGGELKRLSIFRAMSAAPGSGPLTITQSGNVSNCQWIVSQWENVSTAGANGSGAIGAIGSDRSNVTNGLTVQLAPFGDSGNVAYGIFAVNRSTPGITPGNGFVEIGEQSSNEFPAASLQAQWATNLPTIQATWTNLRGGALGIEIKGASQP